MHLSRPFVGAITLWVLLVTYAVIYHNSTAETHVVSSERERLAFAQRIDAVKTSAKVCTFVTGFHEEPRGWLPIETPGVSAIAAHAHVSIYVNELTLTPKFTPAAARLLDGQPHDRPADAGAEAGAGASAPRWTVVSEGRHFHEMDPATVHRNGVIRAHREAQQSIQDANKYRKNFKAAPIRSDGLVNDGAAEHFEQEAIAIEHRPLSAYVELLQTPASVFPDSDSALRGNSSDEATVTSLRLNVRQFLEDGVQQQLLRFQFGSVGAEQECMMLFDFDLWDYNMDLSDWDGIGEKDTYIGDGGFGKIHKLTHRVFPGVQVAAKRRQLSYRWENETRALMTMRPEKTITDLYGFMLRPLPPEALKKDDDDDDGDDDDADGHDKSFYDKFRERRDYGQDEGIELINVMDGNGHRFTQAIHRAWTTGKFGKDEDAFLQRLDAIVSDAIGTLVRALVDMRKYNFFHLDIKASNLLYNEVEEWKTYKWKLNDFGTVKHIRDPYTGEVAKSKKRMTTWPYRAPNKHYDYRADMYSVGAVAFEMLTRRGVWGYPRAPEDKLTIKNGTKPRGAKIEEEEYLERQQQIRDFDKCERCLHDVKVLPDALDFLNKALTYSQSERLTLDDALKHPWISQNYEESAW